MLPIAAAPMARLITDGSVTSTSSICHVLGVSRGASTAMADDLLAGEDPIPPPAVGSNTIGPGHDHRQRCCGACATSPGSPPVTSTCRGSDVLSRRVPPDERCQEAGSGTP